VSEAINADPKAKELYERYCASRQNETPASFEEHEGERGPRVFVRTPHPGGSDGGVLVEVARLRSLRSGTNYDDELKAVMRDYPNLANLYDSDA
jgi:hypothetical protein